MHLVGRQQANEIIFTRTWIAPRPERREAKALLRYFSTMTRSFEQINAIT